MTELDELAKRLGARAAERLDVERTAQNVLQRLKDEPARETPLIHQTWLRIAAAVLIVLGGGFAMRQVLSDRTAGTHVAHFVADDLSDLSADELQDVLTSLDDIVASDSAAVPESSTDLRELDAQQLQAVLRSLEG
jgi:hypothetical protein